MTQIDCYLLKDFHHLEIPSNYLQLLDDSQVKRVESMSDKRLHEFFFSRQLLKFALEQSDTLENAHVIERENNAPKIKINKNQHLNISITHSSIWLGVALCYSTTDEKVGVDIETIRGNWSIEKAQFFCNDEQIKHAFKLTDTADRNRYLTTIWTQKEACFKAGGEPVLSKASDEQTSGFLISNALSNDSILSIYCQHKAPLSIKQLSFSGNNFEFKTELT